MWASKTWSVRGPHGPWSLKVICNPGVPVWHQEQNRRSLVTFQGTQVAKFTRWKAVDWTARLLSKQLLGQCDAVLGQRGLDFLLSSELQCKKSIFGNLGKKNKCFLHGVCYSLSVTQTDSISSFIEHFGFLSVLPLGPIVFGNYVL